MRKFLALILTLILCFSVGTMTACGDNYQEASAQELMQIAELMDENETEDPVSFGTGTGYKLTMDMSMAYGGESFESDIDLVVAKVGDDYQLSMVVDAGAEGIITSYYKEGYLYSSANYDGTTVKTKTSYSFDETVTEMLEQVNEALFELDDLIEEMSYMGEYLKCYIDRTGENTKVKVEVNFSESGYTIEMTAKYEIDANYRLVSYSYDMSMMGMEITCSISPYSGTINFPADLDTYVTE